jgi:hypothetical protein
MVDEYVEEEIPDYWNEWKLDPEEFNRIIHQNSNALSAIYGYVAEERLREMFLEEDDRVENIRSPEDQDSTDKGDWAFDWRGEPMKIEVKSLQTHTIKRVDSTQTTFDGGDEQAIEWEAGFHLKGTSDQRKVEYNGETFDTTLMNVADTDVDIMAVNLYRIEDEWRFAFLRVEDLPRSKGNYPEGLREQLARSQIKLTIPLQDPFTDDLYGLMDEVLRDRGVEV